jgi:hypothetical protein
MSKKPEAIKLANILQYKLPSIECLERSAAELRRLHAENIDLRAAIEQAEKQEPVVYVKGYYDGHLVVRPIENVVLPTGMALYTKPQPKREWQGLTEDSFPAIRDGDTAFRSGALWADQLLKEKNT